MHKLVSCLLMSLLSQLLLLCKVTTHTDGISNLGFPACLNIYSKLFLVHCSHGHLVSLPVYLFATLPKRAIRSSLTGKSVQCF